MRLLRARHRPLLWRGRPTGVSQSSSAGEAISATDVVTASQGFSAGVTEAATVSDAENYPGGVAFAQASYRGRNTAILWRQPETSGNNSYTGTGAESLTVTDSVSSTVAFAGNILEILLPVDNPSAGTSGGGAGDYGDDKKKKKKHKVKLGTRTIEVDDPAEAINALNEQTAEEQRKAQDEADLAFLLLHL